MIKGAGEHTNGSAKCRANDGINGVVHPNIDLRKGNDKSPRKTKGQYWFPAAVKYQDQEYCDGEVIGGVRRRKAISGAAMYPVYDEVGKLKIIAGPDTAYEWLDEPRGNQIAHSKGQQQQAN